MARGGGTSRLALCRGSSLLALSGFHAPFLFADPNWRRLRIIKAWDLVDARSLWQSTAASAGVTLLAATGIAQASLPVRVQCAFLSRFCTTNRRQSCIPCQIMGKRGPGDSHRVGVTDACCENGPRATTNSYDHQYGVQDRGMSSHSTAPVAYDACGARGDEVR